ncbi:MAG: hypothetical protein WD231_05285 [Candidatus Woykebacteria bacterium]
MSAFEAWEDPQTKTKFYFSHSDKNFTTGVMVLPPHSELPKHNRPLAYENLVQVSGKCVMKVFDKNGQMNEHTLEVSSSLSMDKGQFHIHANPFEEISYTLFKAEGDITSIVETIRNSFKKIELTES